MSTNKRNNEFNSPVSVDSVLFDKRCEWCLAVGPARWHYTVGGTYHNEQPLLCNRCSPLYRAIVERDALEIRRRFDCQEVLQAAS